MTGINSSRPGGYGAGDRRAQRAVEDLGRLRAKQRRIVRQIAALPETATLADVIRTVNEMRKALSEQ